jgi:hypothetical protein
VGHRHIDPLRAGGEHRPEPPSLPRDDSVAYGINTRMKEMQPPIAQTPVDFILTPALRQELPPPHHPMLPLSKSRNRRVVTASPREPGLRTG